VVPLGEDCGLIEWVPNLEPLRDTIFGMYKIMGHKTGGSKEISKFCNLVSCVIIIIIHNFRKGTHS
jgi:hypothetical protein